MPNGQRFRRMESRCAAIFPVFVILASCLLAIGGEGAHAATISFAYGVYNVTFYNAGDVFTNSSGSTITGSKNWTDNEIDSVIESLQTWDDAIANTPGRQINLTFIWNGLSGNTLGQSYNLLTGTGSTATTYLEKIWREGVNKTNASTADSYYIFNTAVNWNTSANSVGSSQFDFRSAVTHEIGHSLGFSTTYQIATAGQWWTGGITAWDSKLTDALVGGDVPSAGTSGTPGTFNVTGGTVYFTGSNAKTANGGNSVSVYAPATYTAGSSLVHLDESVYSDALMGSTLSNGEMVRQATYLEWMIMSDLGWSLDTATKTWTNSTLTSIWNTAKSWNISGVPGSTSAVRFTEMGVSDGMAINLGGNQSVGSLTYDTSASFSIGGTVGTLTLAGGSITRSASSSGTQTISRPIALGANAVWNIDGDGSFVVSGSISGAHSLTKTGAATLELANDNTYSGSTIISEGTLLITGGSMASSLIQVGANASLVFENTICDLAASTVMNNGTCIIEWSALVNLAKVTGTGDLTVGGILSVESYNSGYISVLDGGGIIFGETLSLEAPENTIAVPEPSTMLLLALSLLSLIAGYSKRVEKR